MEKLAVHIRTLLRDHDRAFIPGLGGFVKERLPARIDRRQDLFLAPSCTLSFNLRLGKEDGLLAERLMEAEGVDFENAKQKVREAAREWRARLEKEGRIELEGIGILFCDEEGRTHFEPNPTPELEPSAYGLQSFFASPVRRMEPLPDASGEEADQAVEGSVIEEEQDTANHRQRIPLKRIAVILIPFLSIFGLGAIGFKTLPEEVHFSELFWIGKSGEVNYSPRKEGLPSVLSLHIPEKEEKEAPFTFRLEGGGRSYTVVRDNTVVAGKEKGKAKGTAELFVVGGCFEVKANAEARVKRLERAGFPARILERKRKGLHVVAFDAYSDRRNAMRGLEKARLTMSDAWLLHWP